MATIALLLCLLLTPQFALAASTTDALEPIDTSKACSLTIRYGYSETVFPDQTVALYKVADVSADFQYTLTAPFTSTGLILNGVQTGGEWDTIRSTLEVHVLTAGVAPTATAVTDQQGLASFSQLTPGLYLASAVTVVQDTATCFFSAALTALPGLGADGLWQYQVAVAAKPDILPPVDPDSDIDYKVLKLWKGDEGRTDRPQSIEVIIYRDGVSVESVTLSEENQWCYSWTAKDDGATWLVAEKSVPKGYTMTLQQRQTAFVLTNTYGDPPNPPPPQTGDSANILLYSILMYVSGALLIILGIARKRHRHE